MQMLFTFQRAKIAIGGNAKKSVRSPRLQTF